MNKNIHEIVILLTFFKGRWILIQDFVIRIHFSNDKHIETLFSLGKASLQIRGTAVM